MDEKMLSEQQFLSGYSQDAYERPSVAADIAAFSLRTMKGKDYRLSPELSLCVLLIRRAEHPYRDQWALPGGFLRKGETIEQCAFRELREETNLCPQAMLWVDTFSEPDRDPRGWIISHAFASVISEENARVIGSTDAAEARWFEVSFRAEQTGSILELRNEEVVLRAKLKATQTATGKLRYTVQENEGLAFDHSAILAGAMEVLRKEADDMETVFSFLPETFTLSALQKVQETLTGISLLTANFRRKIADYVEQTDEYTEGAGHRPARIFRKKVRNNE